MAVLDIVQYGAPILRKECKPVTDYSVLPKIIEDMFDTMYEEDRFSCEPGWNRYEFDDN